MPYRSLEVYHDLVTPVSLREIVHALDWKAKAELSLPDDSTILVSAEQGSGTGQASFVFSLDQLALSYVEQVFSRILPEDAMLAMKESNVRLSGDLHIFTTSELVPKRLMLDATIAPGWLSLSGAGRTRIEGGTIALNVDFVEQTVEGSISSLALPGNGRGIIQVSADLSTKALAIQMQLNGISAASLPEIWPEKMGKDVRTWVVENIRRGQLTSVSANMTGQIGDGGTVQVTDFRGNLTLDRASLTFLRGMPPLTDLSARAKFDETSFHAQITSGHLKSLRLVGDSVAITNIGSKAPLLAVQATLQGDLPEMLHIVDQHESIDITSLSNSGISVDDFAGDAVLGLHARIPLVVDLRLAQISLSAKAQIRDGVIRRAVAGQSITGITAELSVTPIEMRCSGSGSWDGNDVDFALWQRFGTDGQFRQTVKGLIDTASLRRFGLDASPWVSGKVDVDVTQIENPGAESMLTVHANLEQIHITIPMLDWNKPIQERGRLSFSSQ